MKKGELEKTVSALMAKGKGILAADESEGTCGKRFDKYGIEKTAEVRREWRELLFSSPEIEEGLSGIILFDETIRQKTSDDTPFVDFLSSRGIISGIKVDQKTELFDKAQGKPMAGSLEEEVTRGLVGLSERLTEYAKMGAKFTKWRAVIRIGEGLPTKFCLQENAKRMAEYAFESQKAGLVPIVEPEVLLDGTHSLKRCEEVIEETLKETFIALANKNVSPSGLILKSSMVLPGKDSGETATAKQIAEATVRVLKATVPKEVGGIVFLSGGQTPMQATENLNEIAKIDLNQTSGLVGRTDLSDESVLGKPWPLTFSYSRALQDDTMAEWKGKKENTEKAQEVFRKRVIATSLASEGKWMLEKEL